MHPEWIFDEKFRYEGMHKKVIIKCPYHGYFTKTPNHILYMKIGCPSCNSYALENDVKVYLENNSIQYQSQKTFDWLKFIHKQFLDFYIPKYNIAIECQGIEHFKSIPFFGGDKKYKERILQDTNKLKLCEKHNIKIFYYTDKVSYKQADKEIQKILYTDIESMFEDIKKYASITSE